MKPGSRVILLLYYLLKQITTMKESIIFWIASILTCLSISLMIGFLITNKPKSEQAIEQIIALEKKQEQISELLLSSQVVIKKDTFDIVNLDWDKKTVILDNGKELHYLYAKSKIDKHIIKKIDSINNHK